MVTMEEKGATVVSVSNGGSMEGNLRIFENKEVQVEKMGCRKQLPIFFCYGRCFFPPH